MFYAQMVYYKISQSGYSYFILFTLVTLLCVKFLL